MNSKEIAKIAGVSRSTVSKVLNGYSNISADTRNKVLETIKKYNYVPNTNAQVLAGKTNKIIGIFIVEKEYENDLLIEQGKSFLYFNDFINSCIKEAFLCHYHVLVDVIHESDTNNIEQFFKNRMISGGIFIGLSQNNKFIQYLIDNKYKLVLIDYSLSNSYENVLILNVKDFEASYTITEKLITSGCKNILYITGDLNKKTGIERRRGYLKALQDYNLPINEKLIINSNFQKIDSYKKIKKFLKKNIYFDAVFAANDTMAYSFLEAKNNLNLEKNVPIWGFDNLKYTFIQGIKTVAPNFKSASINAIKFLTNSFEINHNFFSIDFKLIETIDDYLNS